MRIPDEEMARLCRSALGDSLSPETRVSIAAVLEGIAEIHGRLVSRLSPEAEPQGHAALLGRARRDG
ncbi:MAG: hypothetical protein HYZ11_10565 [Candidatus Tectomicrobia bacterium]|uniref:Uncharacterized protein n=1 Tax=Tectimicrobiota bacterium TaxID=2528274 RepID=A0A932MMU9_UNCTE|nr:hypothetical protein [Candidatus Tectomicrobia bacterium]